MIINSQSELPERQIFVLEILVVGGEIYVVPVVFDVGRSLTFMIVKNDLVLR